MHKLTGVEAQRVIAVMEDTLDKLDSLSYVPCTARTDLLDALKKAGAGSFGNSLQVHWRMESDFFGSRTVGTDVRARRARPSDSLEGETNALTFSHYGAMDSVRNMAGKGAVIGEGNAAVGAGGAVGAAIGEASTEDILEQVYQSTRALCRTLRRSPGVMEVLIAFAKENPRPRNGIVFDQYLRDLMTVMYRRLSITVEEEAVKKSLLQDLTECEKLAEDERDSLQQTLRVTRMEKEREVSALDATIQKRREELQELKRKNSIEMESMKSKAAEAMVKAEEEHERKGRGLLERIDNLEKETGEAAELHEQEEAASRKKKTKAEVELAATVGRYDRDMAARTAQIEEIKAKMSEEQAEFAVLKEHFDRVDASARQQWMEEEALAVVREKVELAMRVIDGAATKVQSLFRGRRARAEFLKSRKKSKKGGKGKGGKKKK